MSELLFLYHVSSCLTFIPSGRHRMKFCWQKNGQNSNLLCWELASETNHIYKRLLPYSLNSRTHKLVESSNNQFFPSNHPLCLSLITPLTPWAYNLFALIRKKLVWNEAPTQSTHSPTEQYQLISFGWLLSITSFLLPPNFLPSKHRHINDPKINRMRNEKRNTKITTTCTARINCRLLSTTTTIWEPIH